MTSIFKRVIVENITVKDVEHKILDTDYVKTIYLFGIKVYEHYFTDRQNIEDKKDKGIGFKTK